MTRPSRPGCYNQADLTRLRKTIQQRLFWGRTFRRLSWLGCLCALWLFLWILFRSSPLGVLALSACIIIPAWALCHLTGQSGH